MRMIADTLAPEREGHFLDDLYDRLAAEFGSVIHFPNLRERRADIIPLFQFYIDQITDQIGGTAPKLLQADLRPYLEGHAWPLPRYEQRQSVLRSVNNATTGLWQARLAAPR